MKKILSNLWRYIKHCIETIITVFTVIGTILLIALMLGIMILFFIVVALGLWRALIYLI